MSISLTVNDSAASEPPAATFQTLAKVGRIKLDRKVVQVSGARGTTGQGVTFTITNVGNGYLRFGTDAFTFTGQDAAHFAIVGSPLPRNVPPGKRATFTVALKPTSTAPVDRVLTAKLDIKQTNRDPQAALAVRGLATTGEGNDKEPSLARILELFQYGTDVGDATPNTTFLDVEGDTDQVTAPRFVKARNGFVTIEPLAQFAPKTNTFAGHIGTYEPGTPDSRKTLFSLAGIEGQSVNPTANGSASFDPGNRQFGLFAEAPKFIDAGQPRIIYGEDVLNTWEPNTAKRNKVKVYSLIEKGEVVENAYVVAFEEYTLENDQNDYVFVIRNVAPLKSQPELGLITLNGQADPERLAFNRIETPDVMLPNVTHDVGKVRIINTGNKDLVISNVAINVTSNAFQLVSPPTTPLTLRRNGGSYDLTVKFVEQGGDIHRGTVVLTTSDRDEPTKTISLTGFWQSDSENNSQGLSQEPTLREMFAVLGYRTQAVHSNELIDGNGETKAVGDEVLADAWMAADPAKPVFIQELASFHAQGNIDQMAWYPTGKPYYGASDPRNPGPALNGERNLIFENNPEDGQSLFPRINGSTTARAQGSFNPGTQTFGLRVSGEFSDDELNNQVSGDLGGHHFRFYPARDENNNFIPDTWLVAMDFSSINFDYNDHLLLVKNMKPADRPASVTGLTGVSAREGNVFEWADVPGAAGYDVLRADRSGGPYLKINDAVLTTSAYVDSTVPLGRTRYYRIVAVNDDGDAGTPANLGVTRPQKA